MSAGHRPLNHGTFPTGATAKQTAVKYTTRALTRNGRDKQSSWGECVEESGGECRRRREKIDNWYRCQSHPDFMDKDESNNNNEPRNRVRWNEKRVRRSWRDSVKIHKNAGMNSRELETVAEESDTNGDERSSWEKPHVNKTSTISTRETKGRQQEEVCRARSSWQHSSPTPVYTQLPYFDNAAVVCQYATRYNWLVMWLGALIPQNI